MRVLRNIKARKPLTLVVGLPLLYWLNKKYELLGQSGVVRFSRAGFIALETIVDYKWSLWRLEYESEGYYKALSACHQRGANRLLILAQKNGGVFIKVGQHIASLNYLLPQEYTSTLSILHSRAPKSSLEDIKRVFSQSLHREVEDVFDEFDPTPCGAASLAQVHRARLKSDKQIVAVKVQHPMVKARSFVDIATMDFFVKIASFVFPDLRLKWLVEETRKNLPTELDFLQEASNAERIRYMFAHFNWLKIPRIFHEYTSDMVLTMEFCSGGQVNDLNYYDENHIDKHDICRKLGKLYSEMIFVNGNIHCDPHPGNVLVRKNAKTGEQEIVLLDHGLYVNLPEEIRLNYAELWMALMKPKGVDETHLKQISQKLGISDENHRLFACIVTLRPWKAISQGITKSKATAAEGELIRRFATALVNQISSILDSMPRQILLILKTNDLLRSISFCLRTQNRLDSFTEMSRCCTKALYAHKIAKTNSFMKQTYLYLKMAFILLQIRIFELYLIVRESIVH